MQSAAERNITVVAKIGKRKKKKRIIS